MKCNYKRHLPVMEERKTITDSYHFGEWGCCFALGEVYPDFKGVPDNYTLTTQFGGLTLICTLNSPTQQELYYLKNSYPKFALAEDNNIMFFLSKFGNMPWSSSATNYSLSPYSYELEENANLFTILVFDTRTGQLICNRTLGLDFDFTKTIVKSIKKQISAPCTPEQFSEKVRSTYRKFPAENDILETAYCVYDFAHTVKSAIA